MASKLNAGARDFTISGRSANGPSQVSALHSSYLESRVLNLEAAFADLHHEVDTLKERYHDLHTSIGKAGPQPVDLVKSCQSAKQFEKELEQLSREVIASINGQANKPKTTGSVTSQKSVPPHLRRGKLADTKHNDSAAPNLSLDTTKHIHDPLITDGPIDTIIRQPVRPEPCPSPPLSPSTIVQNEALKGEASVLSSVPWKPHFLTTLEPVAAGVRAKIPNTEQMVTFTFDTLQNTFGGTAWSPGLRYINSSGASLLANRTYYMLDPTHEPYLPKVPGEHGAKLTAFFNKAPEDEFDNLPEGTNSYTNVPMFVQVSAGRYAYFGNYSQTRWSDKLDHDTMTLRVPQVVKEHIAKDLAATPREPWVTQELKKHFFPKPEYTGALPSPCRDDVTSVTVDEEKQTKQVESDMKGYIQELTEWEREADMKTAMMKKDFILDAFDAADADDPPALRLWWEYLECVDFKLDFYNMLVGLQARSETSKRQFTPLAHCSK